MRVLHICESVTGGIATYLNELIPHQVQLYGASEVGLIAPQNQIEHLSNLEGHITTFPSVNRKNIFAQLQMLKVYINEINHFQPEILHVHSTFAGFWVRVYAAFLVNRKFKIVYCSHGWAFERDSSALSKFLIGRLERLLGYFTDKFVCISEHDKQSALQIGLPKNKLFVVKNTISPIDFALIEPISELNTDKRTFLFVGRFDKQKGFDLLLDAVKRSESRDFVVYCIGDNIISNFVYFPKDERLVRLGWQTKDVIISYMRGCDALIMPSRWEGFGLVALEAIVAGCPVFHSGAGGLSEIYPETDYSTILKQPLSDGILEVLENNSKNELLERKRDLLSNFTFSYSMIDLCNVLNQLYEDVTYE
jgi:glycosyltransferase involved in cell wall biosynthesis